MKITNSQYEYIVMGLTNLKLQVRRDGGSGKAIDNLINNLETEYTKLAKKNVEGGMTAEEEEIYPSRLNTEYGEPSLGRK